MKRSSEKEWYYGNVDKERLGPYSFEDVSLPSMIPGIASLFVIQMKQFWADGTIHPKTRCWAQGMDGWRPLQTIPQLKWCLMATGQAVMNETELATLILNMLIQMSSFYPSRYESQIYFI
jgi:DnaJ family protein C protein 13